MFTVKQRIKLSVILGLAILLPLVWMLALVEATTPLIQSVGIAGCVGYAVLISLVSAWLLVAFIDELRKI